MRPERLPVAAPPLALRPLTRREARHFIARHHSHNKPPSAAVFQIGAEVAGELVGVVMVGVPVARNLMDGTTLEVLRVATAGHPNACSKLYGAAAAAAKALGYRRLVTYTLLEEPATALRATGWQRDPEVLRPDAGRWGNRRGARHQVVNLFGEVSVPIAHKRGGGRPSRRVRWA